MKPRICFVIGVLAHTGGTERVCVNIANALSDVYDVTILSTWKEGEPKFSILEDVHIDYVMSGIDGKIYHFFNHYFDIKYRKYFTSHRYDIVIDVDLSLAQYTIPALQNTHTKVIEWEQFNYKHSADNPDLSPSQQLAMKYSSKIVVLTKQDYDMYRDNGQVPTTRLMQIYNATPLVGSAPSPRTRHLAIAVGRLSKQKGFDILLRAWSLVENSIADWELAIIGSGEEEQALKALAAELVLQRVSFIPATKDIVSWYDKASCFLLSSRYEGFVMVLLEAMAKGLPPVAFDCVAGPREIIDDGYNGFLVPMDGGYELFAKKTIELLKSHELQDQFAVNARKCSEDFSISSIRKQWIDLIEHVLSE